MGADAADIFIGTVPRKRASSSGGLSVLWASSAAVKKLVSALTYTCQSCFVPLCGFFLF